MWRVQVWHQVSVVVLGQLLALHWELLTFGAVYPSLEKSHFLSPLVTTGATPSLPDPSVASCTSCCYNSHLQIVGCINTMLFLCEQWEDVSHAPSLQPACLCTCSALKQAHLTFNSNYTLIVTKPHSQDILAEFFLQKQSKMSYMCRAALCLRLHMSPEKKNWPGTRSYSVPVFYMNMKLLPTFLI